jgi:Protein of unknown function (DUF2510)
MAHAGAARRGWSIFLVILVIVMAIIGVIIANIPLTKTVPLIGTSITACPSLFQSYTGQSDIVQGLTSAAIGNCDDYWAGIFAWLVLLAILIVVFLIIAIPLGVSGSGARRRAFQTHQVASVGAPAAAPAPSNVASAGWYADPAHPGMQRYWNGMTWTEDYRPVA